MYELRQLVKGDKLNGLINVAATKAKHFHSKGRVRGCCFVLFISKLWLEMQSMETVYMFMWYNHYLSSKVRCVHCVCFLGERTVFSFMFLCYSCPVQFCNRKPRA